LYFLKFSTLYTQIFQMILIFHIQAT